MKTITILHYGYLDIACTVKGWQPSYDLTWDEYVNKATSQAGEGILWKAVFKV